jgi:putative salt-induced outer membrane protein YdiY
MRKLKTVLALALMAGLSAPLAADEVIFNNGDHIHGKIEGLTDGKLNITSPIVGKIAANLKDVKTFSTDGPIVLQMADGTVIHQKVIAGPDGQVTAAPGGPIVQQNFPISGIAKVNPPPDKWTGNAVAGGFLARGNTDIDNFNASAHAQRRSDNDRLTLDAGYIYARQKPPGANQTKTRTEDNWFFEGKYDYFFSKKLYAYGDVRVERDLIADLSLRLTPGVGVGYQWFDDPKSLSFNTEGGLSWLYRDYSNDGTQESVALRLAYHLKYKVNDQFSVFHDMEYFPALDEISDFYYVTDLGIHTEITKSLFTEFKIDFRHDNRPAPGFQKDDVRYTAGVGWKF